MVARDDEPISQLPTLIPSCCEVCGGTGSIKETPRQLVVYCDCPAGAQLMSSSKTRHTKIGAEKDARRLGLTGVCEPPRSVRRERTCVNCSAERPAACLRCHGVRVNVSVIKDGTGWR